MHESAERDNQGHREVPPYKRCSNPECPRHQYPCATHLAYCVRCGSEMLTQQEEEDELIALTIQMQVRMMLAREQTSYQPSPEQFYAWQCVRDRILVGELVPGRD